SSADSPAGASKTRSSMKRRRFIAWRSPSFLPPYSLTSTVGRPGCLVSGSLGVLMSAPSYHGSDPATAKHLRRDGGEEACHGRAQLGPPAEEQLAAHHEDLV